MLRTGPEQKGRAKYVGIARQILKSPSVQLLGTEKRGTWKSSFHPLSKENFPLKWESEEGGKLEGERKVSEQWFFVGVISPPEFRKQFPLSPRVRTPISIY